MYGFNYVLSFLPLTVTIVFEMQIEKRLDKLKKSKTKDQQVKVKVRFSGSSPYFDGYYRSQQFSLLRNKQRGLDWKKFRLYLWMENLLDLLIWLTMRKKLSNIFVY